MRSLSSAIVLETAADVIEAIRRGRYDALKAMSPHHPSLRDVLTPITAEMLLTAWDQFSARVIRLEASNAELMRQVSQANQALTTERQLKEEAQLLLKQRREGSA